MATRPFAAVVVVDVEDVLVGEVSVASEAVGLVHGGALGAGEELRRVRGVVVVGVDGRVELPSRAGAANVPYLPSLVASHRSTRVGGGCAANAFIPLLAHRAAGPRAMASQERRPSMHQQKSKAPWYLANPFGDSILERSTCLALQTVFAVCFGRFSRLPSALPAITRLPTRPETARSPPHSSTGRRRGQGSASPPA